MRILIQIDANILNQFDADSSVGLPSLVKYKVGWAS
jgi:hypothetical protein